jgi:hypothetical protein
MDFLTWVLFAIGVLVAYGLLYIFRRRRERIMQESRARFVPLTDDPSEGFVCCINGDGSGGRSIIRVRK